MTIRAAKWAAVLVFLLIGAVGATPDWQVPEAEVRLRVLSSSLWSHQVRVDLPESLRGKVQGVRAMLSTKAEVPADLVYLGDQAVAVELLVPRQASRDMAGSKEESPAPVEVYLLDAPPAKGTATPIAQRIGSLFHRTARRASQLTTSPFTATEAVRLLGQATPSLAGHNRPPRAFFYGAWDAVAVGQVPNPSRWGAPAENQVQVLQWSTDLRIESPRAVAFGADQAHMAWFLYADGQPVADWRTSVPDESGKFLGPVVELAVGFHLLEYIVIQRAGETVPGVFWRDRDGKAPEPIPAAIQHSVRLPTTVLVERKDGLAGGFSFARADQRMRARSDNEFLELQLAPVRTDGKELPAASLVVDGTPQPVAWVPAPVVPAVQVPWGDQTLLFPARNAWISPLPFAVEVRLEEGPVVLSADQPYPAVVRLDRLDGVDDPAARIRLQWRLLDRTGAALRTEEIPCNTEREGAETSFALPLAPATRTVELRVTLDGLEIAGRQRFGILRPEDSLVGLHAAGRSLFVGNERTVLVCAPLAPLPALPPSGRAGAPHLVILDDFWATVSGPQATLRPEKALGTEGRYAVFRLAADQDRAVGAAGELRKFELLPPLLDQRADAVLLALGREDVQAGVRPQDVCRHLLFLAQAARAHDVQACLMALPSLPGISPEATRETALLVKELGMRLGVPVVDVFSAENLGFFGSQPFAQYFAAAEGTVTLTTPNDAGRQRLADLVRQVLCP